MSFQDNDFTLSYRSPFWEWGGLTTIGDIEKYSGYSHTIKAVGGYWDATITFPARLFDAEVWYREGLARDIQVFNPSLVTAWNGFVNEIQVKVGTFTATRGPLVNVANKVSLVYSTVDTSVTPPVMGIREQTDFAEDTDSQDKYGIITKILSTGGTTPTNAEHLRDVYLSENKEPETSQHLSIGQTSNPEVTLRCLGYAHWLNLFPFSDTNSGTRNYDDRIKDVVGAEPNSVFSSDYSKIEANTLTVPRYDNDNRLGWQVIKGIINKGDSSLDRNIFGIYNDRKAYYNPIPTDVEYFHRIVDNKYRIEDTNDIEVKTWNVRPGKWLEISDWLISGDRFSSNLRSDARKMFIETINYTAPNRLVVNGSKVETLPQLLGQLGLSGLGT